MKRNDLFPSKYLKASDIPPAGLDLTITRFAVEEFGDDREKKGVVYFREVGKDLPLNRTNYDGIAGLLGDETDGWVGGRIGLYTVPVTFRGETKPAIRVRAPRPPKATKSGPGSPTAPAPPPDTDWSDLSEDDEPPFDDEATGS